MGTAEKRDTIGTFAFFFLSILLGIVVLPAMVLREVYQYNKYLKPCGIGFEWWDIIRYGIFIIAGSIWHWCIIEQIWDSPVWWLYV